MTRRMFTEEEKTRCERQIQVFNEEVFSLNYLEKYATLMFEEGLEYSYNKQKKEYAQQLKNIKTDIKDLKDKIATLQDQISNGVETKEPQEG